MVDMKSKIISRVMNLVVYEKKWSGGHIDLTVTDNLRNDILQFVNRCFDNGSLDRLLNFAKSSEDLKEIAEEAVLIYTMMLSTNTESNVPVGNRGNWTNGDFNNKGRNNNVTNTSGGNSQQQREKPKLKVNVYYNDDTTFAFKGLFDDEYIVEDISKDNEKSIVMGLEYTRQSYERVKDWADGITYVTEDVLVIFMYSNTSLELKNEDNVRNLLKKKGAKKINFVSLMYKPGVPNQLPNKVEDKRKIKDIVENWN